MLPQLLPALTRIVVEQAGAQSGVVILVGEEGATIAAETESDGGPSVHVEPGRPLGTYRDLPQSVVNYVLRSRQPVLLDDAALDDVFGADEYIRARRPRSLLCQPVLRKGRLVALIYLENNLTTGAFTPARLGVLELLGAQAAISLENALLYQRSQEAIRTRDEFLSVASHELRAPLTSLRLQTNVLERLLDRAPRAPGGTGADPAQWRKAIELFDRQTRRLGQLVDQLLDVSRIRVGRFVLAPEPTDLSELVTDCAGRYREEIDRAGCTLVVDAEPGVVAVADRSRAEQVVVNLLTNAIKYGPGKPIEISLRRDDGVARLHVRDHGIGMRREDQQRVFQRFERAVSARQFGGLGLGLYIARRIVDAHGGQIHVESEPGEGATFTVELPLGGPPAPAA